MAQCPPKYASDSTPSTVFRDMIIIGKELTIAFSAIDKLVTLF